MAYNTKSIVKDINQKPVPQYYNPTNDVYEVLQGANGANRVTLYTSAGQAIDLASLIATIVAAINDTSTTQLRAGANKIGKVDVDTSALPIGASTAIKQEDIKTLISNTIIEIKKPVKLSEADGLLIEGIVDALEGEIATLISNAITTISDVITAINTTGTTELRAGTKNIGKIDVSSSALPTGASTSEKQNEVKTLISNVITELGKPIKLHELNDLVGAIEDIYNKDETKTLYLNSNETKPTSGRKKGDKVFEIDTGDVHMWNGTEWTVI